jgi:uncharacterized protein with FMN-binding domain
MKMRCKCSMIISTLALVPYLAGTGLASAGSRLNAANSAGGGVLDVSATANYADGHYTGGTYDAYYGQVQTRININNGHIVSVDVLQYPNHTGTSRYINSQALPILKKLVVQAQDTPVNFVSGATLTSVAFLRSVNSALSKAGN